MLTSFRSQVPFVPVPNKLLSDIHTALGVTDKSIVYDLGCGEGRVLFYLSRRVPNARYIGIENNPFPLLLIRARAWWHTRTTGTSIEIVQQDFFTHDLSNATHIFTYLYPNVMDDLLPKFDRELARGTKLVSLSFKFTQKQPLQEIDLKKTGYLRGRKLYVYEF